MESGTPRQTHSRRGFERRRLIYEPSLRRQYNVEVFRRKKVKRFHKKKRGHFHAFKKWDCGHVTVTSQIRTLYSLPNRGFRRGNWEGEGRKVGPRKDLAVDIGLFCRTHCARSRLRHFPRIFFRPQGV